jgi:thioredoxin-like negative regulator of GroEL
LMFGMDTPRSGDFRHLHMAVISLLDAQAFTSAKKILESLFELGDHSPTMQLAYATCLIETGQCAQAGVVIKHLRKMLDHSDIGAGTRLRAALAAISERLPGGPWNSARLESLKSDAMRMMPTVKK